MNHDYIVESNLIDQYLLGKLAADQVDEFEAHFVDCPECIDQISTSRSFIRDLKGLAVQETLFPNATSVAHSRGWRFQDLLPGLWPAIACVSVVVALGIAFVAVRRLGRLEAELHQANADAAAASQKYQELSRTSADSEKRHQETNQELAQRLNLLEDKLKTEAATNKQDQSLVRRSDAPEVNFPIYSLIALARTQASAPVEITPPKSSSRFALSIPVEDSKDFSAYRVLILDQRGVTVFKQGGFKPDAYHALSLSLRSNSLKPGTYDLRVEGLTAPHQWSLVGTYPFRVITRR